MQRSCAEERSTHTRSVHRGRVEDGRGAHEEAELLTGFGCIIDTKIKNCLSFQFSDADVLRNNLVMAAAHVCATTTPRARASYNEDSLRKLINGQSVGRTLPRSMKICGIP